MPEEPRLDIGTVLQFLELLRSPRWVLTSIVPDGPTRTKTFASADACSQFAAEENEDGKNIYWSVAEMNGVISKKATKADVKHTWFLHVDADPADDETPEAFKARLLPQVRGHPKEPALVVDSGNGLQIFWRLTEPCADQSEVEAANCALATSLGADPSTRNVDRIMRLPGTINFPNKSKLKRGRVKCATRLVYKSDAQHSISDFAKVEADEDEPTVEVDLSEALPVVDLEKLHPLVKAALEACKELADRSARMTRVAKVMVEHGYTDDEIAAVLTTEDHPVSEKYYSDDKQARRWLLRAIAHGRASAKKLTCQVTDLFMLKPEHKYIDRVTRDLWPAVTVDGTFPLGVPVGKKRIKTSRWIDRTPSQVVDQMSWMPGRPTIVEDCFVSVGGVIEYAGKRVFNVYQAPRQTTVGDPTKVGPWTAHVQKLFPQDWAHIVKWLAWRLRRPDVKINHALVLGSKVQGIGKDALLEPACRAVGHWNCHSVTIGQVMGRFNGFLKAVILRVSEARDLGGSEESRISRTGLYDHMKDMLAESSPTLRIDEKNRQEYYVPNVLGVVITTNYKAGGIYLPAEDRRHFVAWSDCTLADFDPDYFTRLFEWYRVGDGYAHVEAYLRHVDISDFDPKAPPPKTAAFWEMASASAAPEYAEIASALDEIEHTKEMHETIYPLKLLNPNLDMREYWPKAVTLRQIMDLAAIDTEKHSGIYRWMEDRRNRRAVPNRLEQTGYTPVKNGDGHLWSIRDKGRMVVYSRVEMSADERYRAATRLATSGWDYRKWNA